MCVCVCLLDDTAAGCRVFVAVHRTLVAVDVVLVRVTFPLVLHLSDGDQLHCLPLRETGRDRDVKAKSLNMIALIKLQIL